MSVLTRPISRIYTPPTCTLEVTVQPSILSRWTQAPAIKSLQFLLSFEGISRADREPIELRGDQTQLASLSEAVSNYLQTLLASRASELTIRAHQANGPHPTALLEPPALTSPALTSSPQLRALSLLTYELSFGSLANEQSGASVVLKVSQLYDLASALDDYTADFQTISTLAVPSWRTALPLVRSAAVVLLCVGLGTATWRFFQPELVAVDQSTHSPSAAPPRASSLPSSRQALPPLKPQPVSPLTLPTVALPTRTPTDFTGANRAKSNPDTLSRSQPSSNPQDQKPVSRPNQSIPGDIAMAPPPANSPPPKSSRQSAPSESLGSAPQVPTQPLSQPLSQLGKTNASDQQMMSRSLEAAPGSAPQAAEQPSLFDTIPQVAEVRSYVAEHWHPPSPPPKTLEYRLTLNSDGSLAQIDPIGTSARQYLTQLSLPALKSPFVSAVASGGQPVVRVVISPEGTVQTFLDKAS